jgi:hypothetical protein
VVPSALSPLGKEFTIGFHEGNPGKTSVVKAAGKMVVFKTDETTNNINVGNINTSE